jgi:hypothetical protein
VKIQPQWVVTPGKQTTTNNSYEEERSTIWKRKEE